MNKPLSKNIVVGFFVITILIVAGLSYWVFKYVKESDTQTSPTATSSVKQSPTIAPTTSSVASPSPEKKMTLKIFMIAEGDNGKTGKLVGCGDSVVAVDREIPQTQAVLKAAIEELLSIKDRNYGSSGLYNSLYQSNLQLQSVEITNNKATIKLTGTLTLAGVCDNPRPIAQLEETAKQFNNIQEVEIFINDKNIREVISSE